jgi:purine-cytosine permease-like protein
MREKISITLKKEFFERFVTLITGAFTFVAALAWNDAIQSIIRRYISSGKGIVSQLVYAILVTLVAVLAIMQINAVNTKLEKETEIMENRLKQLKEKAKNKE